MRHRVGLEVGEPALGDQPQLVPGQQRVGLDQGVAGRARVEQVAGEQRLLGGDPAARHGTGIEHAAAVAGPGQVGRRDQAVVARSGDDDVGVHQPRRLGRDRAAQVQRADLRMLEHLAPGAREPHHPVLQHDAVRAQLQARARILLDQQDRLALLVHRLDHLEHDLADLRVEPHRRLVEDDQLRVEHQAARELDQPLLAAGQAPRLLVGSLADDRVELLDRPQSFAGPGAGRAS